MLALCPRARTRAPLRVVTAFSRDGARRPNPGWLGGLSYRCVLSLSGGAVAALAAAVLAVAGAPVYAFPVIKATALAVGAVSVSNLAVEHFSGGFINIIAAVVVILIFVSLSKRHGYGCCSCNCSYYLPPALSVIKAVALAQRRDSDVSFHGRGRQQQSWRCDCHVSALS